MVLPGVSVEGGEGEGGVGGSQHARARRQDGVWAGVLTAGLSQ